MRKVDDKHRATRLTVCSLLLASSMVTTTCCLQAKSLADIREHSTLKKWKQKAENSNGGKKLLALLNSVNRRIKHNSTDKVALFKRGYLYGVVGCTESAIADLSKAIEIDPYYSKAYVERGICYLDQKDYVNSLRDLNRALKLNSWSGDARLARGRLLLELNKPYLAERDLRACTVSSTKFVPALPGELSANYYNAANYYLGKVYEKLGRRFDAVKQYEKFEKASRKYNAGWLHRYSDKPEDASTRVKKLSYKL